jgi:D-arabinose 1-dehydrogenase-like Zn-dependent alcohol dehydrogenase
MTATVFRGLDGTVKRLPAEKPEADGPFDVVIKITHSGLCASDHAYVPYGIALGHEGVGIVVAIGSAVTRFQIGDRAGGGYLRKACGDCALCLDGKEIWCHNRVIFGEADYGNGTIADYYKSNEKFLYKIPENLSSEDAAPLQCAGATVYSALTETVKPGNRVGIMGIGGLGHLAIQFAAKMGAEVVVFSTTPNKESEARSFGASEFVLSSEPEAISSPVDVLIVAGGSPDWPK